MRVLAGRPSVAGSLLLLCGLAASPGCQSETPLPAGVPKGAALLAEAVGPVGERDVDHEPPWEVESDGMLYLRNVTSGKIVSRPLKAGQTLTLYRGWISVAGAQVDKVTGRQLPQRFVKERIIARFAPLNRYEIYYRPGMSKEELAAAGPTTKPAAEHVLVPLEPVPVYRRRDADSVDRPKDDLAPARPVRPEGPPVLVPVPR